MKPHFSFFCLFWIASQLSGQISPEIWDAVNTRYPVESIHEPGLPAGAAFKGKFLLALKWHDKSGETFAVFSETEIVEGAAPSGGNQKRAGLGVNLFLQKGKTLKALWHYEDQEECAAKNFAVHFLPQSITVTDIDLNGMAELCFSYTLVCQDDTTPVPKTLVLFEDGNQYRIRGETELILPMGRVGGEYTLDAALKEQDLLKDFALRRWKATAEGGQ